MKVQSPLREVGIGEQAAERLAEPGQGSFKVLSILVVAALIVASIISCVMTFEGLVGNGNFRSLKYLPEVVMAAGLTVTLQIILTVAEILFLQLLLTSWGGVMIAFVMSSFIVGAGAFEAFHSMIVQTDGSIGQKMMQEQAQQLTSLHERVTALSQRTSDEYQSLVSSYEQGVEDAKAGRDISGDPRCRQICRERQEKVDLARLQYSRLEKVIPAEADSSAPLNARWFDLQARKQAVESRTADLQRLYEALNQTDSAQSITIEAKALTEEVNKLRPRFESSHQIDSRALAISNLFEVLSELPTFRDKSYILAIAYALSPLVIQLMCGLTLYAIRYLSGPKHRVTQLRKRERDAQKEVDLQFSILGKEFWGDQLQRFQRKR